MRVGQWDGALEAAEGAETDHIITQDFETSCWRPT